MIDLVIPVCKPGDEFLQLLAKINNQSYPVGKIILMNTEEQ